MGILASLFVLSVVAEPEAQHFTAGFVQHHNGAVVPQDTDSVQAAKVQHLAAKNTAYLTQGKPLIYGNFPALPLKHYLTKKVEVPPPVAYKVKTPAHTYPINPFYHVYQPHVYTHVPTVHHFGKREAEAEPEADAQYIQNYNTYGYTPYTTGYQTYGYTGYPYTTGYTYSPYFNNFYNRRVFKREAEAEAEPEADAQYMQYYNPYQQYPFSTYSAYTGYPTTYNTYTYSPYTYNLYKPYHFAQRRFVREAEAEPEAEADAQYYYNTGYYGNYQSGFRYPYTSYARTPYTYNTYSPYNFNYNAFNGYYRY